VAFGHRPHVWHREDVLDGAGDDVISSSASVSRSAKPDWSDTTGSAEGLQEQDPVRQAGEAEPFVAEARRLSLPGVVATRSMRQPPVGLAARPLGHPLVPRSARSRQ
jgi:hypothetical protein